MIQKTKLTMGIVAVAAAVMVSSRLLALPILETAAKMTASSAFVALALMLGATRGRYGRLLLVGLVLSWFGDLFLAGSTDTLFLFGLVSFLLAHVAYTSAFISLGLRGNWILGALVPVTIFSVTAALWLAPFVPAEMATPVNVYIAVISVMVVAATGAHGNGATVLIPVGAILFYFSDLSVSAGQFVQPDFPNFVWGLPFYFGAQVLLALSVKGPAHSDANTPVKT
jgi:uncharacterized membrane protein YhhN